MALLLFSSSFSCLCYTSSSSSRSAFFFAAIPSSKLSIRGIDSHPKVFNGICIHTPPNSKKMGTIVVKASAETDGTGPTDASEPPLESKSEAVSVDKLPLESKLQERMEQKLKMKMAKKIRLRRKRLVRKRRMRKKGRWPPSKMKKLKNV